MATDERFERREVVRPDRLVGLLFVGLLSVGLLFVGLLFVGLLSVRLLSVGLLFVGLPAGPLADVAPEAAPACEAGPACEEEVPAEDAATPDAVGAGVEGGEVVGPDEGGTVVGLVEGGTVVGLLAAEPVALSEGSGVVEVGVVPSAVVDVEAATVAGANGGGFPSPKLHAVTLPAGGSYVSAPRRA